MIKCKSVKKFRTTSGRICGYRLVDSNGKTLDIDAKKLKEAIAARQLEVINLTLTKDNRLVDRSEVQTKVTAPDKTIHTDNKKKQLIFKKRLEEFGLIGDKLSDLVVKVFNRDIPVDEEIKRDIEQRVYEYGIKEWTLQYVTETNTTFYIIAGEIIENIIIEVFYSDVTESLDIDEDWADMYLENGNIGKYVIIEEQNGKIINIYNFGKIYLSDKDESHYIESTTLIIGNTRYKFGDLVDFKVGQTLNVNRIWHSENRCPLNRINGSTTIAGAELLIPLTGYIYTQEATLYEWCDPHDNSKKEFVDYATYELKYYTHKIKAILNDEEFEDEYYIIDGEYVKNMTSRVVSDLILLYYNVAADEVYVVQASDWYAIRKSHDNNGYNKEEPIYGMTNVNYEAIPEQSGINFNMDVVNLTNELRDASVKLTLLDTIPYSKLRQAGEKQYTVKNVLADETTKAVKVTLNDILRTPTKDIKSKQVSDSIVLKSRTAEVVYDAIEYVVECLEEKVLNLSINENNIALISTSLKHKGKKVIIIIDVSRGVVKLTNIDKETLSVKTNDYITRFDVVSALKELSI